MEKCERKVGRLKLKISIIVPVYNVEKYIRKTLRTIEKQTLQDFEVIIVNDDSPDNSQIIIDEFCQKDNRFKCYKILNGGVAAARNYGLKHASGEYILFVDGDDLLTRQALEKMYRSAITQNADMVVGVMQEFGMYGRAVFARTKRLAVHPMIDRYDPDFFWTFSVCNKLMRRETIKTLKLQFSNIKHAEDGIFMFTFLYGCQQISGCDAIVYKYRKRPFWHGKSATQALTLQHFQDLVTALNRIETIIKKQLQVVGLLENEKEQYLERFYERAIEISLLSEYYRRIWNCDKEIIKLLKRKLKEYREQITLGLWEGIIERNADLRLEQGLMDVESLMSCPLVTVALSSQIPHCEVCNVINSIYNQKMPAFVIYVHGSLRDDISEDILRMKNLIITDADCSTEEFKNKIVQNAKSPYIHFIDEAIYLNLGVYKNAIEALEEQEEADFVSGRLKFVNSKGNTRTYPIHEWGIRRRDSFNKNQKFYQSIDWMSGNKLFKTERLLKNQVRFNNNPVADIRKCYEGLKCNLLCKGYFFSHLSESEMIKNAGGITVQTGWSLINGMIRIKKLLKEKRGRSIRRQLKKITKRFCKKIIPMRKRVFFISIRSNDLIENNKAVFEQFKGKKRAFSHRRPHSFLQRIWVKWNIYSSIVIVTDDYLSYMRQITLRPEQKLVQLWHACGAFKKFGLDNVFADITREIKTHQQYDAVIVSSKGIREIYARAFGIEVDKVAALGVPRTDALFDEKNILSEKELFYEKYPELQGKRLILYAPTFREDGTKRVDFEPGIDWDMFSGELDNDTIMIIKNHPMAKNDLLNGMQYKNIMNMAEESTNRLLMVCDLLITDYSSVVFEAALLEKKLLLYCPDFDTYQRDFYLHFPEDLYGEMVGNQMDLLKRIKSSKDDNENTLALKAFKDKYLNSCDGHSSTRVANFLEQLVRE